MVYPRTKVNSTKVSHPWKLYMYIKLGMALWARSIATERVM